MEKAVVMHVMLTDSGGAGRVGSTRWTIWPSWIGARSLRSVPWK